MGYLYFAGAQGTIAIDLDRGIVIHPPRDYRGTATRAVSVQGSVAYVLDTPEHLTALDVEPARMTATKGKGRRKGTSERQSGRKWGKRKAEPSDVPAGS